MLAVAPALASSVQFDYAGTVKTPREGSDLTAGTRFSGTFTFDTEAQGDQRADGSDKNAWFNLYHETISLQVEGLPLLTLTGYVNVAMYQYESSSAMRIASRADWSGEGVEPSDLNTIIFLLSNPDRAVFRESNGALMFPLDLSLEDFPVVSVSFFWDQPPGKPYSEGSSGYLDMLRPTPVPEPSTVVVVGLGILIVCARRSRPVRSRRRIF
jgi:hypothetical protein